MAKLPVIPKSPVIVWLPVVLMTVLSTSIFIVSVGSIDVVIPSPPETVNVSESREIVFVPVSAAMFRLVEMLTFAA